MIYDGKKMYGPEDLGIDLSKNDEQELFKWFVASILFAKCIQQVVAARTYGVLLANGLSTPEKFLDAGWHKLVKLLGEGHYVRYDFSTATKFLDVMGKLLADYGSITNLLEVSNDRDTLKKNIMEFKGLGPKTAEIFTKAFNWPMAISRRSDQNYEDDLLEKRHSLDDEEADIFNPRKNEPRLPGDYETPFASAKDTGIPKIPDTHPATDTGIDQAELYDEGLTGASGADDQEEGDAHPKKK